MVLTLCRWPDAAECPDSDPVPERERRNVEHGGPESPSRQCPDQVTGSEHEEHGRDRDEDEPAASIRAPSVRIEAHQRRRLPANAAAVDGLATVCAVAGYCSPG